MTHRYFAAELPPHGGLIELSDAEARHALVVMRVKVGQDVTLFDGQGHESRAVIVQVGRNQCICQSQRPESIDREPSRSVHLGIALPKPERARELIERLTELGVETVSPLIAQRTQRPPSDSLIEKLRRGVIEACKQCGRNRLLQIAPTVKVADFFAAREDAVRLIAHISAESTPLASFKTAASIVAAVGPEGGWTDDEMKLATEHGFTAVNLGKRVYRIETAATVLASVLIT
jgi:16S rRNA (uracil1498-N3)-methyltransferase